MHVCVCVCVCHKLIPVDITIHKRLPFLGFILDFDILVMC